MYLRGNSIGTDDDDDDGNDDDDDDGHTLNLSIIYVRKCFGFPKHFEIYYLFGLFISIGEKLFQRYILKSFLVSAITRKYGIAPKSFFCCALSIAPPSPPPNPVCACGWRGRGDGGPVPFFSTPKIIPRRRFGT